MARRFSTQTAAPNGEIHKQSEPPKTLYPFGFDPTFHRYRLDEPQRIKKPQTIFVCSMGDLFGEWVPNEWIEEVFDACAEAPWHTYLFLTKNPKRLNMAKSIWEWRHNYGEMPPDMMWFGTSITTQNDLVNAAKSIANIWYSFLSIEPLLGEIDITKINLGDSIINYSKNQFSTLGGTFYLNRPKWIIIGAETGNRKEKVVPKREWIESIVEDCSDGRIQVFMKNSLADIWKEPLIQEYPWR